MNLSRFVADIDYIRIDTGDELLHDFNKMNMIAINGGFALVPMTFGGEPFYTFSEKGELTGSFSRMGRSKDEYVAVRSVSYSDAGCSFIVTDITKKILAYDTNGECRYVVEPVKLENYISL